MQNRYNNFSFFLLSHAFSFFTVFYSFFLHVDNIAYLRKREKICFVLMNKICFREQKCQCMLESYEVSFFLQGGDISLSQLVMLAVYLTDTILSQNSFLRAAVATHIEDAILRKAILWCQINSRQNPPITTSLSLSLFDTFL